MSKSKGNLVAPEEILDREGADALRLAHLFVGPPQDSVDWEGVGIEGSARFLHRLWRLATGETRTAPSRRPRADRRPTTRSTKPTHRLIARVTDEYERWSYNTSVAAFMEFTNDLYKYVQSDGGARRETLDFAIDTVLLLMAPMTPHITAELWARAARGDHIHEQSWPTADPAKLTLDTVTMVVQVNGKVRDKHRGPNRHRRARSRAPRARVREGPEPPRRHDPQEGHRAPTQAGQHRPIGLARSAVGASATRVGKTEILGNADRARGVESHMLSLSARIEQAADAAGSIHFASGDTVVDVPWRQLHDEARAMAAALQARGVEPRRPCRDPRPHHPCRSSPPSRRPGSTRGDPGAPAPADAPFVDRRVRQPDTRPHAEGRHRRCC